MKTEVYSWRVSAQKKLELEMEARREGKSVAQLLDEMSSQWIEERKNSRPLDDVEQERIRKRVLALAGSYSGGDPQRAANASERVREILRERYGRKRAR
jgi:hypothetical protein